MIRLSVDLGSRWLGVVASDGVHVFAGTLDVDPKDPDAAADAIVDVLDATGACDVILELGRGYCGAAADAEKTAAKANSIIKCRDTMVEVATVVRIEAKRRRVPVRKIGAQTWRSNLGLGKDRSDTACRAAVLARMPGAALADEHQVDALGAMLGILEQDRRTAAKDARAEQRAVPAPRGPRIRKGRRPAPTGPTPCPKCGGPRKGHLRSLPCPPPGGYVIASVRDSVPRGPRVERVDPDAERIRAAVDSLRRPMGPRTIGGSV